MNLESAYPRQSASRSARVRGVARWMWVPAAALPAVLFAATPRPDPQDAHQNASDASSSGGASARANAVELIGVGTIPPDARDFSGLTDALSDGTPHDRLASLGSAIDFTGEGHRYVLAADRGPKDGAVEYRTRLQFVDITPGPDRTLTIRPVGTALLTDERADPLIGRSTFFHPTDRARGSRYDPEGVRASGRGTYFVSEEYAPAIDEFRDDGRRIRRLAVPQKFAISRLDGDPAGELPPHNRSGRQPNRGFEGLAISPDGSTLWAALQSPLIQDRALDASNERVGVNIRVLSITIASGATREYVYPLENPKLGVSEILAVDAARFLVLERDGKPGDEAKVKRVYLADFSSATDVTAIESLPIKDLPPGVRAAEKSLLLDLLDPVHGQAGASFPEKIEGLSFGPPMPDGRRTLLVTSDNDFLDRPTTIWMFALDAATPAR
jgi:hypothetical protein